MRGFIKRHGEGRARRQALTPAAGPRRLAGLGLVALVATLVPAPPASAAVGDITEVAGSGLCSPRLGQEDLGCDQFGGDGGAATSALLNRPQSPAFNGDGKLMYFADRDNHRVRVVNLGSATTVHGVSVAPGQVATVAGDPDCGSGVDLAGFCDFWAGGYSGDGGPATSAKLNEPHAVAVDDSGNLYIADTKNHRVRKVDGAGTISTVVGNSQLQRGFSRDGLSATGTSTHTVTDGATSALSATVTSTQAAFGDKDVGASISGPGIPAGTTIVSVNSLANSAQMSAPATATASGVSLTISEGILNLPYGLAVDRTGDATTGNLGTLYIADLSNRRVRKVTPSGTISTVAGNGLAGSSGDGGSATAGSSRPVTDGATTANSQIVTSTAAAFSASDVGGSISGSGIPAGATIVTVDPSTNSATISAKATATATGVSLTITQGVLNVPIGVALDSSDTLLVTDQANKTVRKVPTTGTTAGTISLVAGNNAAGGSGDGGSATAGSSRPVTDGATTSADTKVTSSAAAFTGADLGASISGPGIPAGAKIVALHANANTVTISLKATATASGVSLTITQGMLRAPFATAVDDNNNLYISDEFSHKIRFVNRGTSPVTVAGVSVAAGHIATVAGNGGSGSCCDGQSARSTSSSRSAADGSTTANSKTVTSVAAAFSDSDVGRLISGSGIPAGTTIMSVDPDNNSAELSSKATATASGVSLTITEGVLNRTRGVAVNTKGNDDLYIADTNSHRIRRVDV